MASPNGSSEFLSKDDILGVDDYEYEDVHIPEWGGKKVRVCRLTGTARDAFEAEGIQQRGRSFSVNMQNLRARLLVRTLVNEKGDRLFNDQEIQKLGSKSAKVLDRIFTVAQRLSGLRTEDIESLAKNSDAGQSDDSTTDSLSL